MRVFMNTTVKTPIVKVGNSQEICLPKIWLEQLHLKTEVKITVESNPNSYPSYP